MSRFVRASKYRHVFGQSARKENGWENIKISSSAWDTNLIAASGEFLSINYQVAGGGAFAILPIPGTRLANDIQYKLPDIIPLARGHSGPVLDTCWSPFDDKVVASGAEDGRVLIWKVEYSEFEGWGADKWVPRDFEPVARIAGSGRKIGQVLFHPTASHVLASASGDHTIKIWDLASTEDARATLNGHTDTIQSFTFNPTGTLLVTTCRDRKIRLFDPRTGGDPVRVGEGHGGIKGARVVWLGEHDRIASTGFSKMSDRQLSIWETGGLGNLKSVVVDQSAGVLMPFWSDNNILFLAGKGDGNIRYYEYESDTLFALSEHKSSDPQRGMCFLPRRALDVSECEIGRAFKVYGTCIEPISFIVPRKADGFQADIFPPAPSLISALTAAEFFSGKTAPPNLVDLDTGSISAAAPASAPASASVPGPSSSFSTPTPAPAQLPIKSATAPPALHVPEPAAQSVSPTPPAVTISPAVAPSSNDENQSELQEENTRLEKDLREARAQIRNLELQVESLKANANKAKALLG